MVQAEDETAGSEDLEALAKHRTRVGEMVEDLEEADHVEALLLEETGPHDVDDDGVPQLGRRLRDGVGARLDAANRHIATAPGLLEEESVAAADLEQGVLPGSRTARTRPGSARRCSTELVVSSP